MLLSWQTYPSFLPVASHFRFQELLCSDMAEVHLDYLCVFQAVCAGCVSTFRAPFPLAIDRARV